MPGFTTHYLFGVNNCRRLKKECCCRNLLRSIESHKTVFQLGLQGPDIFFYHLRSQLKKVRPGSVAHTKWTGDFLKYLMEAPELFTSIEEKQIAQAYVAGFIGHYVLDTQMHPYVYDRTGFGDLLKKKGYADHIALETDIDAALLMRYAKCLPSAFPYGKTIAFGKETAIVVAEILYDAYNSVFAELGLSRGFFIGAIRSMQIGTRLTYNPHNYKRQIVERAEYILFGQRQISPVIPSDFTQCTQDPLNLEHRQWKNPWDPEQRFYDSVPELIKKASGRYQEALRQLDCLYETDSYEEDHYHKQLEQLCALLGQQSFHSGLDWILGE